MFLVIFIALIFVGFAFIFWPSANSQTENRGPEESNTSVNKVINDENDKSTKEMEDTLIENLVNKNIVQTSNEGIVREVLRQEGRANFDPDFYKRFLKKAEDDLREKAEFAHNKENLG